MSDKVAEGSALLSTAERRCLEAVCDALLPSLTPGPGDDPRLFALSAGQLGVADAIESALLTLDKSQQGQFRLLLRSLEQPLVGRLLAGETSGFSGLSARGQERALLALARSRLPQLRAGFQGLKRLAAFLFYSLLDERGTNPTWPALGYIPSTNPPAIPPPLTMTTITRPTTLDCDVCVIGSGAGGSVVAAEMAATGRRVIVLEAGGAYQAADFDQREMPGMQGLYYGGGLAASRDLGISILAGATLGGGTAVNFQTALPLPPDVRDEWAALSGCPHFADESFTRSIESVMARLHVGTAESGVNPNNAALRRGCEALGYDWSPVPRNALGCDDEQCGNCMFGCRRGGKQSASVTYLRDAQAGDTRIIANCHVERLVIENGKVTGVRAVATDPTNSVRLSLRVHAGTVVVAAGAIGSPALLMRSGLDLPAIGRNLFLHPVSAVGGLYDAPVYPWKGAPQTIMSDEFAHLSGLYGFRLEVVPGHPGLLGLATPWYNARGHRRFMQKAGYESLLIALVRDRNPGRVRLGAGGRPTITYRPGKQEQEHLQRGVAEAARIHMAAGAGDLMMLHSTDPGPPRPEARSQADIDAFCRRISAQALDRNRSLLFSAHQMGTCRMGSSKRDAVCGPDGEVFGVRGLFVADASAFPSSSGVNPMITVMAMAHHTAQWMKRGT
ncbi:MAG: GMC family oxidoreductase N-terminal domain-containing protein [Chloroflexota bacterium]